MSMGDDYTPIFTCEADFEKIWRKDENVKSKCFSDISEDIIAHSFVFKSFRNEYETEHLFTKKSLKQLKSGELNFDDIILNQEFEAPSTVPGYKPESFIPTNSVLTRKEMTNCFAMYQELCKNKTISNEMLTIYNEYLPKIQKEQKHYQTIAKEAWLRTNKDRLNLIKPEVAECINQIWKERLGRVSWYPKHYIKVADISLVDPGENKISEMTHVKLAKHVGLLPRYTLPNLKRNKLNVYKPIEELKIDDAGEQVSVCSSYKTVHKTLYNLGYHPDVSKDKVAENIALHNHTQIVLSSSGFLHLFVNHPKNVGKSWNLPVTIKESCIGQDKSKIVYIDKALTKKSLSAVERIKWFTKIHINKLLKSFHGSFKNVIEEDTDPFEGTVYDVTKLESFGVDEDNVDKTEKALFSSGSDCELTIDTNQSDRETENEDCMASPSSQSQSQKLQTKQRLKEKISYNLWSLTSETSNMLLKSNLKNLDILIRSKSGGKGKGKSDLFQISPKLEYQTEFGAEAMTVIEALQDWGNILIRPGYQLLRARLDALTGDVVMFEKKTLQDLTNEIKRLYSFNPHSRLTCIHILLAKILEFEPGNYLLSHSPENETFAQLYKLDTSKPTFNLSLSYQEVNSEEIAPPRTSWCPIDQFVLTPTFLHFRRIPAMFHPKRAVPFTSKLEIRQSKELMKKQYLARKRKKKAEKKKIEKQHLLKTISDSDT